MRVGTVVAVVLATVAGVVLVRYGTLDPCGILRVQMREEASRHGGADAFLANAIPDGLIDAMIAAQYGPLNPGRCLSIVMGQATPQQTSARR